LEGANAGQARRRLVIRYGVKIPSDCADWPEGLPRYAPGAHFLLENPDGTPGTDDLATLVDPFTLPPSPADEDE
jgi:hypothetical protein